LQLNILAFREKFGQIIVEDDVLVDLICDKFGNYGKYHEKGSIIDLVIQRYLTNADETEIEKLLKVFKLFSKLTIARFSMKMLKR
jgi:hypothetical protein